MTPYPFLQVYSNAGRFPNSRAGLALPSKNIPSILHALKTAEKPENDPESYGRKAMLDEFASLNHFQEQRSSALP